MVFNRFEARLEENAANVPMKAGDDLVELRWFTKDELKSVKLVPGGREFFIEVGYITE